MKILSLVATCSFASSFVLCWAEEGPIEAGAEDAPSVASAALWRSARNCGPNALYLLLRSTGAEVDYEELVAQIDLGPKGSTLPQLQGAAQGLGFETVLCKGVPSDLYAMKLPVVAHMDYFTGDLARAGHYAVIVECNEEEGYVDAIDGTTIVRMRLPMEEFRKAWSGYMLRLEGSRVAVLWLSAVGVALVGGLLFAKVHVARSSSSAV